MHVGIDPSASGAARPAAPSRRIVRTLAEGARHPAVDPLRWFREVAANRPGWEHLAFSLNCKDPEPVEDRFPEAPDESFEGFSSRMTRILGEQDYCLVINHLRRPFPELWADVEALVRREFGAVLPDYADMGLFLGAYQRTPLGIHQDPGRVFIFPLVGVKCLRFWDQDYVRSHPDLDRRVEYEAHLAGSELVATRPGEGLFIPVNDWHIAESDGAFGVSLSVYDVR